MASNNITWWDSFPSLIPPFRTLLRVTLPLSRIGVSFCDTYAVCADAV